MREKEGSEKAKLLKRGEKVEPIIQIKDWALPEGIKLLLERRKKKKKKKGHTIGRFSRRVSVHLVWWEWGQDSRT